jgi:hypothetical protein
LVKPEDERGDVADVATAAPHRQRQVALAGEGDAGDDVGGIGAAHDQLVAGKAEPCSLPRWGRRVDVPPLPGKRTGVWIGEYQEALAARDGR